MVFVIVVIINNTCNTIHFCPSRCQTYYRRKCADVVPGVVPLKRCPVITLRELSGGRLRAHFTGHFNNYFEIHFDGHFNGHFNGHFEIHFGHRTN